MKLTLFFSFLQDFVQRCFRDSWQKCSFLSSVQTGQQQAVQWRYAQTAGWFQKVSMLLWVPCIINHLSSLADVLEIEVWKIFSYRLYFGKCSSVLKIRCLLTSVNVVCVYTICLCLFWSLVVDSKRLNWSLFSFLQAREDGQAACNPGKPRCYYWQCSPWLDK